MLSDNAKPSGYQLVCVQDGIRGIMLQRNVVPTAALALKTNIASLAPLVLPFSELVSAPSWACYIT